MNERPVNTRLMKRILSVGVLARFLLAANSSTSEFRSQLVKKITPLERNTAYDFFVDLDES